MKTFLPIIIFAVVFTVIFTACKNSPNIGSPQSAVSAFSDTTGLSEFQKWKTYEASDSKANTVYIVKNVPFKNTSSQNSSGTYGDRPGSVPSGPADVPGSAQPEAKQKKGWSKAAKGAAIGAGSGAVAGAVINKRNRVVGGVVGGAVGAGVGYGIGRHMDKKDGRY
jgi:hypothetical protein